MTAAADQIEEEHMEAWLLDERMQQVFDRHGPERDRHTDWWRCTEEPWFSLAAILRAVS